GIVVDGVHLHCLPILVLVARLLEGGLTRGHLLNNLFDRRPGRLRGVQRTKALLRGKRHRGGEECERDKRTIHSQRDPTELDGRLSEKVLQPPALFLHSTTQAVSDSGGRNIRSIRRGQQRQQVRYLHHVVHLLAQVFHPQPAA